MSNFKSLRCPISKKVGEKVLLTQSVVRPLWCAAALLDRACRAPSWVFATKEREKSKETTPGVGLRVDFFFIRLVEKFKKKGEKSLIFALGAVPSRR